MPSTQASAGGLQWACSASQTWAGSLQATVLRQQLLLQRQAGCLQVSPSALARVQVPTMSVPSGSVRTAMVGKEVLGRMLQGPKPPTLATKAVRSMTVWARLDKKRATCARASVPAHKAN